MTDKQELAYLVGLVTEASKWGLSEDDTRDTIRLEVEHRISVLLGEGSDVPEDDGRIHDVPKEPASTVRSRVYRENKVRVLGDDGKKHWHPRSECTQVPCKCSKTGFKWVLKEGADG